MKSNPFVYPFVPFKDLSDKTIRWKLEEPSKINFRELKKILKRIKFSSAKIKGKTIEDKILSIFLDKNHLFGPSSFITRDKKLWLEKIRYFTSRKKPLLFTIHGFPFKIPCPIKTDRKVPDLGEILIMLKLNSVWESITKIYKPGAKITLITEGGMGKFVGVSEEDWKTYQIQLRKFVKLLNFSKKMNLVEISEMEKNNDYKKIFKKTLNEIKKLYKSKDKLIIDRVGKTFDSTYRIVSTENYNEETVMDIYNEGIKAVRIVKLRSALKKKTFESIFNYLAYLKTRDTLNFVEKIAPHSLPLSVSPKPGRLGIIPISAYCKRLPYHGVPVYHREKNIFTIEYLIDLRRKPGKYEKVYLKEDWENRPFYYIEI
ncbi:MAG: L-tyrosine/L-tryptophan isonitrile synthase family protein [Patescibacteria group bacterium]